MSRKLKGLLKIIIPEKTLRNLYSLIPEIYAVNIYLLKRDKLISDLTPIAGKYTIKQLTYDHEEMLKDFYTNYKHILPRLKSNSWIGLAVFDTECNTIAYVSWIITENIQFITDFNIVMNKNQFMVRHGYCSPKYRHQGLHTRMEQERINYSIQHGASEIFVHIATNNTVGISTLINNGFKFYQKNLILRIPKWGFYRELYSAIKTPFKKMI